ncbi:SH2 domain-containing protein 3C isoform X1, partial [Tachysurus ichikawai]
FKWFGSLSNLSFRRKSDTAKESSHKYEETSVEDEGMRSNYACSSEMYTHMGTMPRPQKKKDKSMKGKGQDSKSFKTKTKTKSTALSRSQSMRCSDHVIESPLLSALNSKAFTNQQENNTDSKLTQEHQKAESRTDPEAVSTEKIHKEPDNTPSKPPPDVVQEKPMLPRKGSLPVKISMDLMEENTSKITGHHEEERKTSPDPER